MNRFLSARTLLVAVGLVLCGLVADARAEDTRVDRIEVVRAGIYQATASKTIPDKALSAGSRVEVINPTLLSSGRTVTARVGVKFGFEYRIVGEPADAPVTIERVTIFPPAGLRNPDTGETIYREEVVGQNRIGEVANRGYEFDHPWELVPGLWRFELWYANRKFVDESFTVVVP